MNTLNLGTELFVAHNLVLSARAQAEAALGAIPGAMTGPIQQKYVDKVQIQYGSQFAVLENGADFNMTTYGVRFLRISRLMGAGPLQIGTGWWNTCIDALSSANAWTGPITIPGFSNN